MSAARRLLLAAACAAVVLGAAGCGSLKELETLTIRDIAVSAVKDGVYEGQQRNFPVSARVRVTVKGGSITAIELLRHSHGPGHGAEAILERVLAEQSLRVDAVSGSTYSSKVVLKALEVALDKGL